MQCHLCIIIMNKKGPSIEPWGTPVVILPSYEGVSLYITYCFLSVN